MRRLVVTAVVLLVAIAGAIWLWPHTVTPASTIEAAPAAPLPEFHPVEVLSASEGLTLTGVIRDPAGKPVRDAEVFLAASGQQSLIGLKCTTCGELLLSCRARESAQTATALLAAHRGELVPGATTRSDEKGEFRFEHLAGVSFTVWARGNGFGDGL